MFVRLIALLLTIGMMFVATEARDFAPVEAAAAVDVADDAYDVVPTTIFPALERRTVPCGACVAVPHYPGYESFVFRPPRAALT